MLCNNLMSYQPIYSFLLLVAFIYRNTWYFLHGIYTIGIVLFNGQILNCHCLDDLNTNSACDTCVISWLRWLCQILSRLKRDFDCAFGVLQQNDISSQGYVCQWHLIYSSKYVHVHRMFNKVIKNERQLNVQEIFYCSRYVRWAFTFAYI